MILLKVLNNVYHKLPKTRKYVAEIITKLSSRENAPVDQVYFIFLVYHQWLLPFAVFSKTSVYKALKNVL